MIAAAALQYTLHCGSVVDGLVDVKARSAKPVNDPLAALQTVESLVVLKGFHLFLTDPQLILLRKFYDPQKISGRPQNLLDEQPSHTIQRKR